MSQSASSLQLELYAIRSHEEGYPDPTPDDLNDPEFNAVWNAIKGWDLCRFPSIGLVEGATGNDVMHILLALRKAVAASVVRR